MRLLDVWGSNILMISVILFASSLACAFFLIIIIFHASVYILIEQVFILDVCRCCCWTGEIKRYPPVRPTMVILLSRAFSVFTRKSKNKTCLHQYINTCGQRERVELGGGGVTTATATTTPTKSAAVKALLFDNNDFYTDCSLLVQYIYTMAMGL